MRYHKYARGCDTHDKCPSHFSQLPTGRWHSPNNTQVKRMFELAKMILDF